jgi:hypothetical protein
MSPRAVPQKDSAELVRRANLLLPGLYAWAATVLYPASLRGAGWLARSLAAVALVALATGAVFATDHRKTLGRVLGLHGFVAASTLTWIVLGSSLAVERLEPTKAALGGLGWILFAFGWGAVREPARVPEDDPRVLSGEVLEPRGRLPRGATSVLWVSVAGALVPLFFAWRVTRPYHALFAHAVAVGCAVLLVSAGGEIAVRRGRRRSPSPSERVAQARIPLLGLAVVLTVGALEWLLP